MTVPYSRTALLAFLLLPSAAQAWDPNEGANYMPRSRYQTYQQTPMYPERVSAPMARTVPAQNLAAPSYTPPQQAYVPSAPAAPAYVPPAPAPAPAYTAPAPVYTPPPAPVFAPAPPVQAAAAPAYAPPAPVYGMAPTYTPAVASSASQPGTAYDPHSVPPMKPLPEIREDTGNWFGSAGLTYYDDTYKEDSINMETGTGYVGLVGSVGYLNQGLFTMLDVSMATGEADYSSTGSGTADGIREYELDNRILFGVESDYAANQMFTYYTGIGHRYYDMKLKGTVTSTGALGYDRRISQIYIPIGMKYTYLADSGWHFRPGAEFDYMFYGNVSSRLRGTGLGLENVENRQKKGYGLRADFMMGMDAAQTGGTGFEFGPFVRYWMADDSETTTDSLGNTWIEPENSRLQLGINARILF